MTLDDDDLAAIRGVLEDLLGHRRPTLLDAQALADELGVSREYVYRHADELGVIRLSGGERGPLRFELSTALEAHVRIESTAPTATPRLRKPRSDVPLLPVKP